MIRRLALSLAALLGAAAAEAQVRGVTMTELSRLAPAQMHGFQVKLTWLGPQTESVPTIALHVAGDAPDPGWFGKLRTAGLRYENDRAVLWRPVGDADLKAIFGALLAANTVSDASPNDVALSLSIHGKLGAGEVGLEVLLRRPSARRVVDAILGSIPPERGAARHELALLHSAL